MGNSMDGFEEVFLEDLGLRPMEGQSTKKGDGVDYLPVARQNTDLARSFSGEYPQARNVPQRRLTRAEKLIIQEIRETELLQEGANYLTEHAMEREGQARARTAFTLHSEFQRLLLLKNLAYAESEELGSIMEPTIKRMIHDRTNDALKKHNLVEEYDSRLIEESYKARENALAKRTFWNDVFGR
jgi:hypothetical protein